MRSFRIVVSFDVLKNRKLQLLEGMVTFAVCFFFLEIFEKTFTAGIVKRIAFFGKRLHNIQGIQKLPECKGSILGSPVRMEHQSIRSISLFVSLPKGCNNKLYIGIGGNMPGNDFSGVQIHYNTKIVPFPACLNVCNVADPYEIRSFLVKILLQMIAAGSVIGMSG